jgi:hypothetical protein
VAKTTMGTKAKQVRDMLILVAAQRDGRAKVIAGIADTPRCW